MAKRRLCSKCGTYNAAGASECAGCGVQFADLKREAQSDLQTGPKRCGCGKRLASICIDGIWRCGPCYDAFKFSPSERGPGYDVWKRAMEEMRTKHQQRSRPRVEREPGEDFEELFEQ